MIRRLDYGPVLSAASLPGRCRPQEDSSAGKTRVFDMRTYITQRGHSRALHIARFPATTPTALSRSTAWSSSLLDPRDDAGETLITILASRPRGRVRIVEGAFQPDPRVEQGRDESPRSGVLRQGSEVVLPYPTDYSPIKLATRRQRPPSSPSTLTLARGEDRFFA